MVNAKRLWLSMWVLGALLLQGCASAPAQLDVVTSFQPDSGFVAIRLITNASSTSTQFGFFFNQWAVLNIMSSDGKPHILRPATPSARNFTQVFTGMLPQGSYRLKDLGGVAPLTSITDEFEIKAGQFSSLGALIFQPTGNNRSTLLRTPDTSLARVFATEYPELAAQAQGRPVAGWVSQRTTGTEAQSAVQKPIIVVSDPLTAVVGTVTIGVMQAIANRVAATDAVKIWDEVKDPKERLVLAKGTTYSFNAVQRLASGEIVAASNLGQVLVRNPAEGWMQIDTGDMRELTALYASNRANILVGGEEGMLLSTRDGGATWTSHQTPREIGVILGIHKYGKEWLILSVHDGNMKVHATADPASSNWQLLTSTPKMSVGWPSHPTWAYAAVIAGNRYIVSTPTNAMHILDLDTRAWSVVQTPKPLRHVRRVNDQFIHADNFLAPAHRSTDQGRTWETLDTDCGKILDVSFAGPEVGYVLCFKIGAFAGSTRIGKTTNGGKDWETIVSETAVMSLNLFAIPNSDEVLVTDIHGFVLYSKDGGKTWARERPIYLKTAAAGMK